uniref:Thymosin beta n=2 Tax=cellular organisms TaxID=131567 RepID=A0A8R2M734_BOMMO|nr:thymosin isoform X3 [Bombyx mori]
MACSVSDTPSLKDLPKVATDLKSQLEGFNTSCLRDVDTNEKIVLPSAEAKRNTTNKNHRKRFFTLSIFFFNSTTDVAKEKQHNALLQGVELFQPSSLRKTETIEKNILPNAIDVATEKTQKSLFDGIEKFDSSQLKHTETQEKNPLPDKDAIEAEKEKNKFLNGIENFDPTKLKHTETCEKNPLPTKDVIEQEKSA